MVEDGQIDLVSDGDAKNYEKFIFGLSRLNHAFQQVKFWEFTQPCLYLARALPYVTTRRIVEGYMVSCLFDSLQITILLIIAFVRFFAMVYLKCILFKKLDF